MKIIKKILAIFLTICLTLSISACGEKAKTTTLQNEISQEDWNSYRQYVDLSTGIKMSYVEMGNPDGEVIILQHGMTDNSRSWSLTAPYFAKAGYHIYMPDLRGQGKSQETDGYYTTVTYATDLEAFFDAMKIDRAILVGHSLGSFTVQNFWMMFPERCSKIVLVSSIPLKGYQNTTLSYVYTNRIQGLAEDGHPDDNFMDIWYSTTCQESKYSEVFDTFLTNMKNEAKALSKKSWTNILLGLLTSNIGDAYKYFDKSIQALLLHGDQDTMALGKYQQELIDLLEIPATNYKNYDGIGHNIQFEIPEQFSIDVLSWLSNGTLTNK